MDYVYVLPFVKIPEVWTRSTPYQIMKEVCSDAVSKFIDVLVLVCKHGRCNLIAFFATSSIQRTCFSTNAEIRMVRVEIG